MQRLVRLITLSAACLLAACAAPLPTTNPADLKSPRPGFVPGYLPSGAWVNSLELLPPPPAAGSPEQAADDAAYRTQSRAQMNNPRWKQAAADEDLHFPKAAGHLSCALGIAVSEQSTPHLNMLLRRTLADAGLATYRAKNQYKRARPLMVASEPICTPDQEAALRKDGSYPSGHAALGWAWSLVLTELAPERADALAQRGWAFGQSRVVCGVHWQSDVDAGRLVASAVVAQLHGNADFVAQMGAARQEIAAARAAGSKPVVDCEQEAKALAR